MGYVFGTFLYVFLWDMIYEPTRECREKKIFWWKKYVFSKKPHARHFFPRLWIINRRLLLLKINQHVFNQKSYFENVRKEILMLIKLEDEPLEGPPAWLLIVLAGTFLLLLLTWVNEWILVYTPSHLTFQRPFF